MDSLVSEWQSVDLFANTKNGYCRAEILNICSFDFLFKDVIYVKLWLHVQQHN